MSFEKYDAELAFDDATNRERALKILAQHVRAKQKERDSALEKFNAAETAEFTVGYSPQHDDIAVTFNIRGLLIPVALPRK